ncbi:MAG TPA: acyltransferase family protein, partial [Anaeromyxobacteraceae bacterium]|nr:acyltransferase family protein [Anaeromyxobacteraceae bacterium]
LLAILLTGALDAIGSLLGYGIYARATPSALMNVSIGTDHSPVTLIGNLFFLMTAYVPVWGTNGPLWSLKFEWWFYVLYPLLRLCARRSPWPVAIALWAAFALTPFGSLWPLALVRQIASAYAVWWLGALLAERLAGRVTFNWFHAGTLAGLLLPLAAAHADGTRADALWGLAFFGLLSIAFGLKARGWRLAAFEATRWLGALSYTLYVVHFPILVLLSGWLMSRSPTAALPRHFGWVFVGTAATLLVAYAGHLFVERPFLSSRRNLAAPPQPLRKLAPARAAQGVPAFEPAAGGLEASGARSSEAGVARS